MDSARRHPLIRWAVTIGAAGMFLVSAGALALAHGAGDSSQSRVLVLDALAYLANKPMDFQDSVKDKVTDALEAPDKEGVDLSRVALAQQQLQAGNLVQVRSLLQSSVETMAEPVTGEDPGTTVMLDPMSAHTTWAGSGAVLAGLSAVAILLGGWLALRSRPHDSLRALRARLAGGADQ